MTEHLSSDALLDLATGAEVSAPDRDHLASCRECAGRLASVRQVIARLDALAEPAAAPAGLWERVVERMGASAPRGPASPARLARSYRVAAASRSTSDGIAAGAPRRARWALRAAAALGFFLAGAVAQAAWTDSVPAPTIPVAGDVPFGDREAQDGATRVQRAGTAWVTAIAAIAARAPGLPEDEVAAAREVAYAAMYGAVHELTALDASDPAAADIYRRAREAWLGGPGGGAP